MVMPPRVKIGEPFPVRVVVSSLTAQAATVTLSKDGKPTANSKRVELHPGKNVVVFEQNIDKAGFSRYSATLNAPEDTTLKTTGARVLSGCRASRLSSMWRTVRP